MWDEVLIAGLFAVLMFFEYAHPAEPGQGLAGRARNFMYMIIVLTIGTVLATMIYVLLPGAPRVHAFEDPVTSTIRAVAIVFVSDFCFYWYHRAQHKFRALWAVHELHHSDAQMNVGTSFRTYWLDYPIQAVVVTAPAFYLIGWDWVASMMVLALSILFLMTSHANVRVHLGLFTRVLVGPQLHRIHHSTRPEHRNKNLAQVFPIFDILFGTYYHPARDEFPPTGTATMESDAHLLNTVLRPFETWWSMLRRARKT